MLRVTQGSRSARPRFLRTQNAISLRAPRLRVYELYTTGPGGHISNSSRFYDSGMWIARVRAKSIKHAYWLLASQVGSMTERQPGIVFLDSSAGPQIAGWPWDLPMRTYGPRWWRGAKLPPKGWPRRYDDIAALEREAETRVRSQEPSSVRHGSAFRVYTAADIDVCGAAVDAAMRRLVRDTSPESGQSRTPYRGRVSTPSR